MSPYKFACLLIFCVGCQGDLSFEIGPADQNPDPPAKEDTPTSMNPSTPDPTPSGPPDPMTPPGPECGDGDLDVGETCDGDCPTTCDDSNACTADALEGAPQSCNAVCTHRAIDQCSDGDGCCPAGCDQTNDSDCDAMCGNDITEAGETCDGDCPSDCDDGNACTQDSTQGRANMCDVMCQNDPVTACVNDDGCCPPGCEPTSDSDCEVPCTDHDAWPQNWAAEEAAIIDAVNMERAQGANCGQYGDFPPVEPVAMNRELQIAARCHSVDMTTNQFFSHTGSDGSKFSERARRASYSGSPRGENIAAGNAGAAATVTQWMNSDGHCRNIMQANIDRMGLGYDYDRNVRYRHYWTMVTGRGGDALP